MWKSFYKQSFIIDRVENIVAMFSLKCFQLKIIIQIAIFSCDALKADDS